ncbi:MAG: hypothetical protein K0M69_16395 [Youngiibacter sp.]|nr:hypothetical protein [Youngiibacter sp.]
MFLKLMMGAQMVMLSDIDHLMDIAKDMEVPLLLAKVDGCLKEIDYGYASQLTKGGMQERVYEAILDLAGSGAVSGLDEVFIVYSNVNSEETISLARYLEDRNIGVHAPGTVLFFEREVAILLIGFLVLLFPDYVRKLNDGSFSKCDERLLSYYGTCMDFASEAMRGISGKPLEDFINRTSAVHHKLYMATDYSFSGLLYRLLEFDPFSTWLKKGGLREAGDMAVFSRIMSSFEVDKGILALEPEAYEEQVEELFNDVIGKLFRDGTGIHEPVNASAVDALVSFRGLSLTGGRMDDAPAESEDRRLSFFGDIDANAGCSLRYFLQHQVRFSTSRTLRSLRDELVISTITTINEIAAASDVFPFTRDAVSDILSLALKDMGIAGPAEEKLGAAALKQVMRYLGRQELPYLVPEPHCIERLEVDGYSIEGPFTVLETPSGELIALAMFPGKLPGEGEISRKLELLQVISCIHEERTGSFISYLMLFFAGEDKLDPFVTADSDDLLQNGGMRVVNDSLSRIKSSENMSLSSDRELCLSCDFRFHCKRTNMRKVRIR